MLRAQYMKKFFAKILLMLGSTFVVLLIFDVILVATDLIPPISQGSLANRYIGFSPFTNDRSLDAKDSKAGIVHINNRGFITRRSVQDIVESPRDLTIAVVGDSHTRLRARYIPLEKQHPFLLEGQLRDAGVNVEVLHAGYPRYSPLQEYLVYKHYLRDAFAPQVLVMNVYMGNDFYDLVRVDDRPYYSADPSGEIRLNPPQWYVYRDPDATGYLAESRVLGLLSRLTSRVSAFLSVKKMRFLVDAAQANGKSWFSTFDYTTDLVGAKMDDMKDPTAYVTQVLNQGLFFGKYFSSSKERSKLHFRHLMKSIKKENPQLRVYICAIPSVLLRNQLPHEKSLHRVLDKLEITLASLRDLELDLYRSMKKSVEEAGFTFVDALEAFAAQPAEVELYNPIDLHINQRANDMLADLQAKALLQELQVRPAAAPAGNEP